MKQMKINEPKVLKAILNKTKVKDIRKAYEEIKVMDDIEIQGFSLEGVSYIENNSHIEITDKPPKYEINEIVEIIWTGDIGILRNERKEVNPIYYVDERVLAKVKIISREKIEIDRMELNMKHPLKYFDYEKDKWSRFGLSTKILSKEEGFESVEEMFEWLESYADLSTPKPFYLYGMEYL